MKDKQRWFCTIRAERSFRAETLSLAELYY